MTAARADRRGLVVALVSLLAAGLLSWLAAGSVWLDLSGVDAAGDPTGSDLVGLVGAAAPISLAAIGGLVATRGVGRRVVGGLVALAGLALLAGTLDVALRPERAAARWLSATAPGGFEPTGWAWVGALAGALLVLVGVAAVVRASRWPAMSGRYERTPAGVPASTHQAWDAQDRGEDPTAG